MKTKCQRSVAWIGLLLLAGCASNSDHFAFLMGDSAYLNGQRIPRSQYEEAKKNHTLAQLKQQLAQTKPAASESVTKTAPNVSTSQIVDAQIGVPHSGVQQTGTPTFVRTTICRSMHSYDEYPGDAEKFSCSAGVGALTRPQLVAQGWKIDLLERIPAPGKAFSSRGMRLYTYKMELSR